MSQIKEWLPPVVVAMVAGLAADEPELAPLGVGVVVVPVVLGEVVPEPVVVFLVVEVEDPDELLDDDPDEVAPLELDLLPEELGVVEDPL